MLKLEEYLLRYHHEAIDSAFNSTISHVVALMRHNPIKATETAQTKPKLIQYAKFDVLITINLFTLAKWFPKFANMILESRVGFDNVNVAFKNSMLRILDKKVELFDLRPFLNTSHGNTAIEGASYEQAFDDWDELDTNIFNLMSSQQQEKPRFNEIISWLCPEQIIFNILLSTFSMKQLFGYFRMKEDIPMPLNGALLPHVNALCSLSAFQGVILSISSPQGQLLHQGFQCQNSTCNLFYLTAIKLIWIDPRSSSSLSNFCPNCSSQLAEFISARIISSFTVVMVLLEKSPGIFVPAKLIVPTGVIKSDSLLVGTWIHCLGYSDGMFKSKQTLKACDESFLSSSKGANYPFLRAEIEICPIVSCYKFPYFYQLRNFSVPSSLSQNLTFQQIISMWTDSFSLGLCASLFPQNLRLALILSVVSALTSGIGKSLHLLVFHQGDYFIKHIATKLRKYLWNIPWSSTEPSSTTIIQSLQKLIDAPSGGKPQHVTELPLALQLSRNSIFWVHVPLFRSKKPPPVEFSHLVSPLCPCAVLAHTDVPRQSLNVKTDPSYANALSSFDIVMEHAISLSTQAISDALFDLYHQSYDISEFFSFLGSVSSFVSGIDEISFDWTEDAKELIQNYFLAIRSSSSRDAPVKKETFDMVFPEISTSQVEVTGPSIIVPKQYHLGFETPTTIVERIIRLSIILAFFSVPFRGPARMVQIRIEEVVLR